MQSIIHFEVRLTEDLCRQNSMTFQRKHTVNVGLARMVRLKHNSIAFADSLNFLIINTG